LTARNGSQASPSRIPNLFGEASKPYTADPLPFFTEAIRTFYESKMQRTVAPRFGKIDYDVVGAASGNWFLAGTIGYSGTSIAQVESATKEITGGPVSGKNIYSYGHLSISPDPVDTVRWLFSTGWWQDPAGDPKQLLITIADGQPTPDKLTANSGIVVYQLNKCSPHRAGWYTISRNLGTIGNRLHTFHRQRRGCRRIASKRR
jgi:hypothetical protein